MIKSTAGGFEWTETWFGFSLISVSMLLKIVGKLIRLFVNVTHVGHIDVDSGFSNNKVSIESNLVFNELI